MAFTVSPQGLFTASTALASKPVANIGTWGSTLPTSSGSWGGQLASLLAKQAISGAANKIAGSIGGQPKQPSGNFWSSNGGVAAIQGGLGLIGGIAGGLGQSASDDATRKQQQAQFDAELKQRQAEQAANDLLARQKTGLESTQLDPLKQQKSRQQNAVFANILSGARNFGEAGSAGFGRTGGLRLPEGGFGADVTQFFTPEARQAAESQFYKQAEPFAGSSPDLAAAGYAAPTSAGASASAEPSSAPVSAPARSWYESPLAQSKARQRAIVAALDPSQSTIPGTANRNWFAKAGKTASSLLDPLGYQRKV
jgi:hypothetical protein